MINKNSYNILVISLLILLSCVFLDPEAQELLERRQLQEEIDFLTSPPPTFQEYTPNEEVWGEEQEEEEVKEEVEVKRLNLN